MFEVLQNEIGFDHLDLSESERLLDVALDDLRNNTLQIPPYLNPVEWIEENIKIPQGDTFRPGNLKLLGFQRPVALDMMDADVDQITVLKGVQVGWSTFMKGILFYGLKYLGVKIALAQPTKGDAEGYFKDQIKPHFDDILKEIIRTPKKGDIHDTWDEWRFLNRAALYFRGAASDDAFRRISVQWMMGDELDADGWKSTERSQGDKVAMFMARGSAFSNAKMFLGSTPVNRETSLIYREWLESDQRRFFVSCPHCGERQVLKWGSDKTPYGFRWKTNEHDHVIDCWYVCEGEGCRIDEYHKQDMVEAGEFVPTAIPTRPGHRGYHWPRWYSPAPKACWVDIAQQWLGIKGDTEKLKEFINNCMAEPWDDLGGETLDPESIRSLQTKYRAEVPDDVVALTAGVDTQSNKEGLKDGGISDQLASREITIVGWSRNKIPRVIAHHVVEGEPGDASADAELDAIRTKIYRKADGTEMKILATAIDMGGHYGDQTKAYAKARATSRVWAVKGRNNALGTRSALVFPKKPSRSRKTGTSWYMIDTQLAKDFVGRCLTIRGPGASSFPHTLPETYFDDLTAEKLMVDKKGRRYWKRKGKNTGEAWDCLVYAYAALCGLQASSSVYRDLNLAAEKLGIGDALPPHDPETGELLDDAPATSLSTASNIKRTKGIQKQNEPLRHGAEKVQAEVPKVAPKPVAKRKKQGGRVVSSTARRW
ncbi:terminase gpA endonuclease subunit [Ochrobactrum sp. WV_118_8]